MRVVGLGNRMHGDDGLGSCLVEALRACSHEAPPMQALELPTLGDVSLLEGSEAVVIVDAAHERTLEALGVGTSGPLALELDPGRLGVEDLVLVAGRADAHRLDPAQLVAYAYSAGLFRGKAYLIAVPVGGTVFGEGLSREAALRALEAARLLARLLERLGCKLSYSIECLRGKLLGPCRDPLARL